MFNEKCNEKVFANKFAKAMKNQQSYFIEDILKKRSKEYLCK